MIGPGGRARGRPGSGGLGSFGPRGSRQGPAWKGCASLRCHCRSRQRCTGRLPDPGSAHPPAPGIKGFRDGLLWSGLLFLQIGKKGEPLRKSVAAAALRRRRGLRRTPSFVWLHLRHHRRICRPGIRGQGQFQQQIARKMVIWPARCRITLIFPVGLRLLHPSRGLRRFFRRVRQGEAALGTDGNLTEETFKGPIPGSPDFRGRIAYAPVRDRPCRAHDGNDLHATSFQATSPPTAQDWQQKVTGCLPVCANME